jgi:hypothetical protein
MNDDIFSTLTFAEQKKLLAKKVRLANQRISRLEKAGLADISIAYSNLLDERAKPRFSSAKTKKLDIYKEYERVEQFLATKTSQISGTKKLYARTEKAFGRSLTIDGVKSIWQTYNKWKDSNTGLFYILGSTQVQKMIGEVYTENTNFTELENIITNLGTKKYEELPPDDNFFEYFKD